MNDFFDDGNVNKEYDADKHLAELGYGGEGVRMPRSTTPIQTTLEAKEEEYVESLAMEYTQEQEDLLSQADSRLEKANLYRMLLNHDLFGDVDCSPAIVQEVQEELKKIILDKLEVLLGIKAEEQKEETQFEVDLPFNKLQIEALILWANKLTKGKSSDATLAQAIVSKGLVIKPMGGEKRKPAIKKISGSTLNRKRELPREVVPAPDQLHRSGTPRKEVKATEHRKDWVDPKNMSEEERLKHNIKNQDKYKSAPAKAGGLPMPSFEQTQSLYQNELLTRSSQESPLLQNLQKAILETQQEESLRKINGGT